MNVGAGGVAVAKPYLSADELPPRPDSSTGLPEPPKAPWTPEPGTPAEKDRKREHDPALAPKPPPEQGPVLFWYRPSRRGALYGAIIIGVVTGVVLTIIRSIDWVTGWPCWAIIAAGMLLIYFGMLSERYSAGSDWSASAGTWVHTYELVSVKARATGSGLYIDMKDSAGRLLSYKMIDVIGSDPRIWNYTYNGILHSVIAGGAETNKQLHLQLKLPYPESARPADEASEDNADSKPETG